MDLIYRHHMNSRNLYLKNLYYYAMRLVSEINKMISVMWTYYAHYSKSSIVIECLTCFYQTYLLKCWNVAQFISTKLLTKSVCFTTIDIVRSRSLYLSIGYFSTSAIKNKCYAGVKRWLFNFELEFLNRKILFILWLRFFQRKVSDFSLNYSMRSTHYGPKIKEPTWSEYSMAWTTHRGKDGNSGAP